MILLEAPTERFLASKFERPWHWEAQAPTRFASGEVKSGSMGSA